MPTGTYTPSRDGDAIKDDAGAGAAYSATHDDINARTVSESGGTIGIDNTYGVSGNDFQITRAFLSFDTSNLPNNAGIVSAKLTFYLASYSEADSGHATLHVVQGVQDEPLNVGDYGDHLSKTTSGGSIAYSALPGANDPFDLALNATGIGWISKTGTTKFCLRVAGDINNLTPTGVNSIGLWSMETIYDPVLTIVYYAASYPLSESGRVGSLVHRRDVDRGIYNLEITFGGLIATPPSTGRASMAVGAGEQPYEPVPEVIPTCPPGWTLRYNAAGGWYCEPPAITGQPYSKLTNLTPYAQQRAQSLYEQGMLDESGQITEYGRWWISQHPTESPP